MLRFEKIKKRWLDKLEEFGSSEYNYQQKRKLLTELRAMEEELDKYYNLKGGDKS